MTLKNDSLRIIEQSQVSGVEKTFILGCTDRRVTFNTQQTRAFNLVWALFEQGIIKKKSKIAVIGGGLAGMTVSAALNLKGCIVTLYHDQDTLMDIQQESYQRYIHPNIYDWPNDGCGISYTDFPCLNWTANNANKVFEQIQERWEDCCSGIEVMKEAHIDEVKTSGKRPRITIKNAAFSKSFDCVILAVGFGIEENFPNTRYESYWNVDDLGLSTKKNGIKSYLVSGCGDGGLIDVLRLKVKNFNHEKFSNELLQHPDLSELKVKLLQIEQNAPEDPEVFASEMFDCYWDLVPQSLLDNLSKQLRNNTAVELNGSYSTAMSPKACLINRFSVFLLIKLKAISYEQGKIEKVTTVNKKRLVSFKVGDNSMDKEYDEVVVRHGPTPIVQKIIGPGCKLPDVPESEKVSHRVWKQDFYPKTTEKINRSSEAAKSMEAFKNKIDKIDKDASIMIMQKDSAEIYMVCSDQHDHSEMKKVTSFNGIPVYHNQKANFEMASEMHSSFLSEKILSLGSQIYNINGEIGSLGCFVSLIDQRTAFISTSHLFKNNKENKVFFSKNGYPTVIGTLLKKTKLKPSTETRRSRNVVDAALILVETNVSYSRSRYHTDFMKITVQGMATAKIGDKVYKYGAGSDLTFGEVTATHCSTVISKGDAKFHFEEAIMVQGNNQKEFAAPGDSGSVVFREDGKVLGMIFAVSRNAAILCPIEDILREFQCSLLIY